MGATRTGGLVRYSLISLKAFWQAFPIQKRRLFYKPGEWLTTTREICDESSDIDQPTLQTPKFIEILRWLQALNSFDLVQIKMDSFRCDNESEKLAT